MIKYWYAVCSRCQQGRLFIERRDNPDGLFLHCEECEWAWNEPQDVATVESGFLAMDIDSRFATKAEIDGAGWSRYAREESTD